MPLDTQLQPLPPRGSANLGSVSGDIYRDLVIPYWPGQAPQQQAHGQAGPNAALLRLGLEEQENDQIRQLAQQYGDDPDELVRQVARINPKRAYEIGEQFNKSQKEGAEFHLQRTKAAREELQSRLSVLQGADATNWDAVTGGIVKDYPQLTPLFAGRPYSDDFKQQMLQVGRSQDQWLDAQEKAATDMLDEKKQLAAARLIVAADTPQKQAELQGLAKQGGFTRLLGMFDPQSAQAFITKAEATQATTEKTGSDYHQYLVRWAKEHGTTFEQMTTKQEQQARKEYGQADDRPRATVTVQMPPGGANNPDVKYWADQIQKDPTIWNNPLLSGKGNEGLRTAIAHEIATRGGDLDKLTAQTKQMGETAKAILPHISTIEQEAKTLESRGLMGPLGSRWREFVSGTLKATELATNAEDAKLIGKFQADLGLLRSAVARAHGGARGGGSPTMIEHMKTIIQGGGDLPTFQGSLSAVKDWMQTYTDEARLGAQVPNQVKSLLSSKGPGNYTFSDGSKWRKDANGSISKVQ